MDELTNRLRETLEEHCRFATMPVAIKLVKEGDAPKQKAKYPLEHLGHRMAVMSEPKIPEKYHQIEPAPERA